MTRKSFSCVLAMCGALALPVAAWAGNDPGQAKAPPKAPDVTKPLPPTTHAANESFSQPELQILAHVHHADQMEVQAGKLAVEQGASQGVKEYGQMLIDDHGKNDREVLAFAQKEGLSLPAVQPMDQADKIDMKESSDAMAKLRQLHGAEFDKEFLRTMIAMHDKTIAKLDSSIAKATNPSLASMLRDMLPVLEKHRDKARALIAAQPAG